jgi:hypothetical protein
MNKQEYKILNNNAKKYRKTLKLEEVKLEFLSENLLNQNLKLEKGELVNYGLELVPFTFSQIKKVNNCNKAKSCPLTCLVFSGQANMYKSKSLELSGPLKKRIRRDFLFQNDRYFFIEKLKSELLLLNTTYNQVGIRLNVFSDIDWNKIIDFKAYKNIIFYDYTKEKEYLTQKNKTFAYSASENDSNDDLIELLENGFNVAMVFDIARTKPLPKVWNNFQVVDGDINDNIYELEKGVVIGLRQKLTLAGKTQSKFTERGIV